MEKARVLELSMLVLAAAFMAVAVVVNGVKVTGTTTNINLVEGKDFAISYVDYSIDGNVMVISYGLAERADREQEMRVDYVLRDLDGNKVGAGEQEVILGVGGKGDFKGKINLNENAIGPFRLSFSVWNGRESKWVVKEIGAEGMSISGMAVAESTDKTGNIILILLILTFIILLVVLYLRRHNARTEAFVMEKRKLIPFEL